MISHSTNVVEYTELIAQRLSIFARFVGRENVIAGTDYGFSQNWNAIRVHPRSRGCGMACRISLQG